ncbi:hypothetical protein VTK26DRAFT_3383 [Humicola hyalothermophila]
MLTSGQGFNVKKGSGSKKSPQARSQMASAKKRAVTQSRRDPPSPSGLPSEGKPHARQRSREGEPLRFLCSGANHLHQSLRRSKLQYGLHVHVHTYIPVSSPQLSRQTAHRTVLPFHPSSSSAALHDPVQHRHAGQHSTGQSGGHPWMQHQGNMRTVGPLINHYAMLSAKST